MAAFIAKQMVGNQLKSVKGAIGGDKEGEGESKEDGGGGGGGEDPEVEEMRREAERKRKEKHEKAEAEREELRQSIRDKYGLKKKVPEEEMMMNNDEGGRVGRKKKTPAELAAEANADSDDEEFAMPKNMDELKSKVQDIPQKLAQSVGEVTEKCSLQ
ncbi:complexin-like isoform X1 [Crassostrea virginica]|uniref:Complexin-like isoform X2 n=1 Tax=Crassostrea virginica TaxID=6565 RepID=A0A8B8AAU2_CRAVI|nr:complexin-like isoform X2 [Crassostrea virginica]XP_022288286.1 complexin-like isoform X2 [Crassostrea virginica]